MQLSPLLFLLQFYKISSTTSTADTIFIINHTDGPTIGSMASFITGLTVGHIVVFPLVPLMVIAQISLLVGPATIHTAGHVAGFNTGLIAASTIGPSYYSCNHLSLGW